MDDDIPADSDRFEEAIRAFRRRVPMTPHQFATLDAELRAQAFTLATVAQGRVVQEVYDAIDRAIEAGTTLEEFKDQVGATLADAWGAEDAPRLETIFRTEVMRSYNEGRDEVFSRPEVREARPYLRFDSVGDSRDCEICDPLDGTILPAEDIFWASHRLPLHPNCRCVLVPLSEEEARDAGVDTEPPDAEEPAEGFGTGDAYEPDLDSFDPAIAGALRERLG